jgi:hypothetical protein
MFDAICLTEAASVAPGWYDVWKDILIPLIGPLIALGAIGAAIWAARAQVRPLRDQISLMKAQADKDRQHKEYSMAWSIVIEARRLASAAKMRLEAVQPAKGQQDPRPLQKKRLSISVYGLARGDRSDIVFLHAKIQTLLAQLINCIDLYNATIEVLPAKGEENVTISQASDAFRLLTAIEEQGRELSIEVQKQYPNVVFGTVAAG